MFEIACTVADAIRLGATDSTQPDHIDHQMARDVFNQLQKLLVKNEKLYGMLNSRVANNQQNRGSDRNPDSFQLPQADSTLTDLAIEQQLQAHGFDLTDPVMFGQSPDTESLSSDQIGRSPQEHSTQTPLQQQTNLPRGALLQNSLSSSQPTAGVQAGWNHLHATSTGLPHPDQDFTDMDFDFDTFQAGNAPSLGAFQDFGWPEYGMPDHYSATSELPGSMQEAAWPSEKQT